MPNLPATVAAQGGAIVAVLEWEQHQNVPATIQYAVGEAVRQYPELNSEPRVDMIIEMASLYGEDINPLLVRLIDEYSTELVWFALDALYELGERGTDDGDHEEHEDVERLLVMLKACSDDDYPIQTVPKLEEHARHFNGLPQMLNTPVDKVLMVLRAFDAQDQSIKADPDDDDYPALRNGPDDEEGG